MPQKNDKHIISHISASPHISSKITTGRVMTDVIIALIPATAASIFLFRQMALLIIANCVLTAVLCERLTMRIRGKKENSPEYASATLTGLLLALTLSPAVEWYAATLGTVFAIVVGKHIFGGLGSNIFNPALLGRAFLAAAFPIMTNTYIEPAGLGSFTFEAITGATPLALHKFAQITTPMSGLFWGNTPGSIGETSGILLIIGASYMLLRKAADWRIPLSLIASVLLISSLGYRLNPGLGPVSFHLLSGGMLLGAFFMATDPVTSPYTKTGRYIFGAACGIIIMILRYFSGLPEGVMYAILFMNAFSPLINRYTAGKPFGR